ncbi:MAG: pectinesterase family protein, partial [Bacteroidales bacterium]|nr:pectinesterase family protein [Lachnoclostridium sp.]MCM1385511.1 pectinesterase family protein [Lachnoclostridium sp.]MCM1466318.1 pectinesterase family protein [Bacteroidales bacterium]
MGKTRKKERILAVLMSVCMLLGLMPTNMFGGVASVKAAPDEPTYTANGSTTWTFTSEYMTAQGYAVADSGVTLGSSGIGGIKTESGTVSVKNTSSDQALSLSADASIAVPLNEGTTAVRVSITLTSNNSQRWIELGTGAGMVKVYHSNNSTGAWDGESAYLTKVDGVLQPYTTPEGEYLTAVSNGKLIITAKGGETKIGELTVSEYIVEGGSTEGGGNTEDGDLVDFVRMYNFADGTSIIPSGTAGNTTVTSADGKLEVGLLTGCQNAYGYNGDKHGSIFKDKNYISLEVAGDVTIQLGGCYYSKDTATITLKKGDEVIETKTGTKTGSTEAEGCAPKYNTTKADGSAKTPADFKAELTDLNSITFNYTGEAGKLVLEFANAETYIPYIIVSGKEPKPAVESVKATVTVTDTDNVLGSEKIIVTNGSDAEDTHEVAAAGGELTLKPNATYKLSTANADIKATVGGKDNFVTAEADLSVEVKVESTVVNPTVTITGADLLEADDTLTLEAGETVIDLKEKSGQTVKLSIGTSYSVKCSNTELVATVNGGKSIKPEAGLSALTVTIAGTDKTPHTYDVWDFGAEQLADTSTITYNNMLNATNINALYPGVEPGTDKVNIASFTLGDLGFADGGNAKTHRWRSNNTALTRYDNNTKKDEDGNIYGFIYSNSSATNKVYLSLKVKAGDVVKFLVSANNGACDYIWAHEDVVGDDIVVTEEARKRFESLNGTGVVQELTFYAKQDGTYRLWPETDKLVVARIYRERPAETTVSGTVTFPAERASLPDAKVLFTQIDPDGKELREIEAPITNGTYSVKLQQLYDYKVSLKDANGYIVDTTKVGIDGVISIAGGETAKTADVDILKVDVVTVSGSLAVLTPADAAKLKLKFQSDMVFVPEFALNENQNTFTLKLEKGVEYTLTAEGVDDYSLETTTVKADADGTQDIAFTRKPVYDITVNLEGPTAAEAADVKLTFSRLSDSVAGKLDEGYVYDFTGTTGVSLRNGQYKVKAELEGYTQQPTADVKVNGAAVTVTIPMKSNMAQSVAYKETITVGADGCDYTNINDALEAVRGMTREDDQRVTISIQPGNYEEMLVVDVPNVTLKNASASPSIELKNKGVDIDDNAVRITWYYGHGYTYYSMGSDCKYDANLLAANKANGYASFTNPGSGTTNGSYWNATVVISANGFQADGIIFENSFNQYISAKAAEDVIEKQNGAKEGNKTRASMTVGDTAVQQKAYVERAAALAMVNEVKDAVFDNCKFVGRQDTLYGGTDTYAEFNQCSIYGGTDYIMGGMIAIFNQCDLVFNTTDDKNDVGYITAAQQKTQGRGYLMYKCHITSVVADKDVDSAYYTHNTSKPGYLGRPWTAGTSEVVFYKTTIDATDAYWNDWKSMNGENVVGTGTGSLIFAEGWLNTLSGESAGMMEFGTVEASSVDNSESRASWATAADATFPITLADGWRIKSEEELLEKYKEAEPEGGLYVIDLSKGLKAGVAYDGGISVMEDMKSITGTKVGVQGTNNPKPNAGEIPTSGAVLILNAEQDGRLKVVIKGAADKNMHFVSASGGEVEGFTTAVDTQKVFEVEAGETYYLYGDGTKLTYYGITVDYRLPVDWSTVPAPVLGTPVAAEVGSANEGKVTIPYVAQIGDKYSDSMDIWVYQNGELIDTIAINTETSPMNEYEGTATYTPAKSGDYTFVAYLKRSGEKAKESNEVAVTGFVLPMATPEIVGIENQGGGNVKFSWLQVPEATEYDVYLDGALAGTTGDLFWRFLNLVAGKHDFAVVAKGNGDASEKAELKNQEVTNEAKKTWQFRAFGSGVSSKSSECGYSGSYDEDNLSVWGWNGKGKIVPASTDGLSFYYTTIDPETENFTLEADITVDAWVINNGQEGFGLMAADRVGTHGDGSVFWNNSYMLSGTKVEYCWNSKEQMVADSGTKYTMKLGIGAQEKTGVTPENLSGMEDGSAVSQFNTQMHTLETAAATTFFDEARNEYLPAGTYNIVGNFDVEYESKKSSEDSITAAEAYSNTNSGTQTTFHMTLQRNNTGYFLSYTDQNGV